MTSKRGKTKSQSVVLILFFLLTNKTTEKKSKINLSVNNK